MTEHTTTEGLTEAEREMLLISAGKFAGDPSIPGLVMAVERFLADRLAAVQAEASSLRRDWYSMRAQTNEALTERDAARSTDFAAVLTEHEGCRMNDSRDGHHESAVTSGWDVWTCGLRVPFSETLEVAERAHVAAAIRAALGVER